VPLSLHLLLTIMQSHFNLLEDIKGKINNPITLRMYGWSYFKTNEPDKAIENLNEFMKVAPDKVIGDDYKYLGRAYNQKQPAVKGYDRQVCFTC
jgi:tetratricopeptide (TPR) repeat protein